MWNNVSISIDFKEVDEYLDKVEKQLDVKGANCVIAGYFKGKTYPIPEKKGKKKSEDEAQPTPWEIARNAWVHEKGTEHIPARPFMTKAGEDYGKWQTVLEKSLERGVKMPKALLRVGEAMQRSIVDAIDFGDYVALKPATIKRKKGSTKPLFDKGTLRNSAKYEVTKDDTGA